MVSKRPSAGYPLLACCVLLIVVFYFVLVPVHLLAGAEGPALRYLVAGWVPYTLAFFLIGRLFSSPGTLPSMRSADVGLGLVLVSLLLSLGLEAWALTPERVPEAHVLQAIGIFVGLALFGWGVGRRSRAISGEGTDRRSGEESERR